MAASIRQTLASTTVVSSIGPTALHSYWEACT
jgi:hypothetical protein